MVPLYTSMYIQQHNNTHTQTTNMQARERTDTQMAGSVKAGESCFSLKWGGRGMELWCSHPQPLNVIEWNFEAFCVHAVHVDNKANILSLLNTCRASTRVQGNAKRRRAQRIRLDAGSTGKHENMRAGSKDTEKAGRLKKEKEKKKRKQYFFFSPKTQWLDLFQFTQKLTSLAIQENSHSFQRARRVQILKKDAWCQVKEAVISRHLRFDEVN